MPQAVTEAGGAMQSSKPLFIVYLQELLFVPVVVCYNYNGLY